MKASKYLLVLFLSIFFGVAGAGAQEQSYFHRGRIASEMTLRHNGHRYWYSPEYQKGSVTYEGKVYTDVMLNVDAQAGILLLRREGDILSISLSPDMVSSFRIGDNQFISLNGSFYELLFNGEKNVLLRKVSKSLSHSTDNVNGRLIGYEDDYYNGDLNYYFAYGESFWVLSEGQMFRIRKRSDMYDLFSSRSKELKSYARKNKLTGLPLRDFAHVILGYVDPGTEHPVINVDALRRSAELTMDDYALLEMGDGSEYESARFGSGVSTPWFRSSDDDGTVERFVRGRRMKAIYQNKVYELGDRNSEKKQKNRITGHVLMESTGETVPGAVVYDGKTGTYATADMDGLYVIDLPAGDNVLYFSEYSMDDFKVMITVFDDAELDVVMKEKTELLQSALVSAEMRANHKTANMGVEKLNIKTIKNVPAAFGEGDILKAVQALPGVQSVGEASSGINVRGGSSDQNLILFNGNTIYNPSHMFGIFSSFNPDLVENVELYKSSIPAEFGGRISSVMDVTSKRGNRDKLKGSAGIGVLTSHLTLDGPIGKKTTFVLGGRTTYSDYILKRLPPNSSYSDGTAGFTDINATVSHRFAEDNVLTVNGYYSNDKFSFSADTVFDYTSANASILWEKGLSEQVTMNASAGVDHYKSVLIDTNNVFSAYKYSNGIDQAFAKLAFVGSFGDHKLSLGASSTFYSMTPGSMTPEGSFSEVEAQYMQNERAAEAALWLADTWKVNDYLSFDFGARGSGFYNLNDGKVYFNPEGRLSAKFSPNNNLSFKAGINTGTQYINLISNTSSISPIDTWKLADGNINPQKGWQAAGGVYYSAFDGQVDFSLEGYWKRSYNYLDYKSGAVLVMNDRLHESLIATTGKAYGVEFMIKKSAGNLNGWMSYTWSRSLLRQTDALDTDAINNGNWYCAPFDKPHDFKLVANYKFTHRYSMSANVDYSTGRPVTIPVGKYLYDGSVRLVYSDRNAYRIPDYFRLDLGFNIEPSHYLKALTYYSWTIGVYNVTGRKNAYSVYYTANTNVVQGHMLSVFATQIPYVTLNVRF